MLKTVKIPSGAKKIIKVLKQNQHAAYLVGGCIRDLLLSKTPNEWDITTSALPKQVSRLFKKVVPTGIDYGTVTVILEEGQYEVTTFRSDEKYVDGRHPSNVVFTQDVHKDLSRRDFTINALAFDPETLEFIDGFGGKKALAKKEIKSVGRPIERFSEDGLRSVRACRFASQLNFKIEKNTFSAIAQTLNVTKKVAIERINDELTKLLKTDKPSIGLELMRQSGLLSMILPELEACFGVKQPPEFHKYDVYWHSLMCCDMAPKDNLNLRLAALLHDLGKPSCKVDYTFYNHDKVGVELAQKALKRLKFSNEQINKVSNLIGQHMFNYTSDWSDAAVRRFIRRIGGAQNIEDLFGLRMADAKAMVDKVGTRYLKELQKRVNKIIKDENALHVSDLKIDGNDVMKTLKIKPGPEVGKVLESILEKVLDDPALNQRNILLKLVKEYA